MYDCEETNLVSNIRNPPENAGDNNGSGDCRKLPSAGGTLCPSYRATRNEKDTTRARANALRQYLTDSDKENKFDQEELYQVFDLCVSCKALQLTHKSNT